MAKQSQKKKVLLAWAEFFPELSLHKSQFLIQRHGGLLSGICLDSTNNSSEYLPKIFFHNLLVPWDCLTIGYAAPLKKKNGIVQCLNYDEEVCGLIVENFRNENLEIDNVTLNSFDKFVKRNLTGVFLPHFFMDLIILGTSEGDPYFFDNLDKVATVLNTIPNLNLNIIESVETWVREVERNVLRLEKHNISHEMKKLGLPEIDSNQLIVNKIQGFWQM